MTASDRGDLAMRVSTLLVLSTTMLGLLVWYGSITGGLSVATSLLDALSDLAGSLAAAGRPDGAAAGPLLAASPTPLVVSSAPALPVAGALESASLRASTIQPLSSSALWDVQYVYGVSALAGVWVLVRWCLGWRFDRRSLAVVPRSPGTDAVPGSSGEDPDA